MVPAQGPHTISRSVLSVFVFLARRRLMPARERLLNGVIGLLPQPDLTLTSRMRAGFTMELELSDRIQRFLLVAGEYEPEETAFIRDHLPADGVFVDAGAHVGYHSLAAALHLGEGGVVHAFEPYAPNISRMKRNMELNPGRNILLNEVGLSDREETVEIATRFPGSGNATMAPRPDAMRRAWIRTIRMDDYCRDKGLGRIDVLKLDVEGAELKALRGMQETLQSCGLPAVLCEINPTVLLGLGTHPGDLVELLHAFGYRGYRLKHGKPAERLTSLPGPGDHANVAFLR